jgi:hypothetical protein
MCARPSPYWERYLDRIDGASWADLPFFDLEFLFYHALNSLAGFFSSGADVFAGTRAAATVDALAGLATELGVLAPASAEMHLGDLVNLVKAATFGNEADYSQVALLTDGAAVARSGFLVDESPDLLAALARPAPGRAHVIADNAGRELVWDLVLADGLLRLGVDPVVVHVKPWPMFVSDALASDVTRTLEGMRAHAQGAAAGPLGRVASQLGDAFATGRLCIDEDPQWGEPRHFSRLEGSLCAALGSAGAVIAKGDLNYRRFVEDRDWPADTTTAEASANVPFAGFALRVLKSEAVVGIPRETVREIEARQPDWRTDGTQAVIQRLGPIARSPPPPRAPR